MLSKLNSGKEGGGQLQSFQDFKMYSNGYIRDALRLDEKTPREKFEAIFSRNLWGRSKFACFSFNYFMEISIWAPDGELGRKIGGLGLNEYGINLFRSVCACCFKRVEV